MCVCVCVCVWERERERESSVKHWFTKKKYKNLSEVIMVEITKRVVWLLLISYEYCSFLDIFAYCYWGSNLAIPVQLFYWCVMGIQEADQFCGK